MTDNPARKVNTLAVSPEEKLKRTLRLFEFSKRLGTIPGYKYVKIVPGVIMVILKRVEPEENMDRWYMVTVQPTLLEFVAVVCAYGNRQTSWQQMRIIPVASSDEAYAIAAQIVEEKVKRGYVICEG